MRCHSAKEGLSDDAAKSGVREGLDLVDRQLGEVLRRHNVEEIAALDTPFDPARHEAMLMVDDSSRPAQTVCQVMRPGYTLHGRVVRPAQVMVSQGGPAAAPDASAQVTAERDGPTKHAEEGDDADV